MHPSKKQLKMPQKSKLKIFQQSGRKTWKKKRSFEYKTEPILTSTSACLMRPMLVIDRRESSLSLFNKNSCQHVHFSLYSSHSVEANALSKSLTVIIPTKALPLRTNMRWRCTARNLRIVTPTYWTYYFNKQNKTNKTKQNKTKNKTKQKKKTKTKKILFLQCSPQERSSLALCQPVFVRFRPKKKSSGKNQNSPNLQL